MNSVTMHLFGFFGFVFSVQPVLGKWRTVRREQGPLVRSNSRFVFECGYRGNVTE